MGYYNKYSYEALAQYYAQGRKYYGDFKGHKVYLKKEKEYNPLNCDNCYYILFDKGCALVKGAFKYGFMTSDGNFVLYDEPQSLFNENRKRVNNDLLTAKEEEVVVIEEVSSSLLEKLEKELAELMRRVVDNLDTTIIFEKN